MRLVVIAGAIAALVSLLGTPLLIRWLRKHGYAQAIRESTADEHYPDHEAKYGTPSMGGLAMIIAIVVAYFGTHLIVWRPVTPSGLLLLYLMVGLGLVGMADDYLMIF
jgi:phospho-N-acetylmuramoyl-pentapeptide-transferase